MFWIPILKIQHFPGGGSSDPHSRLLESSALAVTGFIARHLAPSRNPESAPVFYPETFTRRQISYFAERQKTHRMFKTFYTSSPYNLVLFNGPMWDRLEVHIKEVHYNLDFVVMEYGYITWNRDLENKVQGPLYRRSIILHFLENHERGLKCNGPLQKSATIAASDQKAWTNDVRWFF